MLLLVQSLVSVVLFILFKYWWLPWYHLHHIPQPRGSHWLWGHLPELKRRNLDAYIDWGQACGGVGLTWFARGRPRVFVTDPAVVRHVLVGSMGRYRKGESYDWLEAFLGSKGLLTAERELHVHHRRVAQRFVSAATLRRLWSRSILPQSEAMVGRLRAGGEEEVELDVNELFSRLTLLIVGAAAFSYDMEESDAELFKEYSAIMQAYAKVQTSPLECLFPFLRDLPVVSSRSALADHVDQLHAHVSAIIQARLDVDADQIGSSTVAPLGKIGEISAEGWEEESDADDDNDDDEFVRIDDHSSSTEQEPEDLLGILMCGLDLDDITEGYLRDEILTWLFAGHETTSSLLSWTMHLLSQHEDILQEAVAEADACFEGEGLTFEKIAKLDVIQRILKEALRLRPPVPMVERKSLTTDVLQSRWHIPPETSVVLVFWALHYSEEHWGPDVNEFKPDRWKDPETLPLDCYMPFGIGARNCIGSRFALLEAKTILCLMLHHFHLTLSPGQRIGRKMLVTLRPFPQLLFNVRRRL